MNMDMPAEDLRRAYWDARNDEREAQEAEAEDVVRAIRALTSPKRGRSRAAARRRARLMATWAGRAASRLIARDGAPSVAKWAAAHTWVK